MAVALWLPAGCTHVDLDGVLYGCEAHADCGDGAHCAWLDSVGTLACVPGDADGDAAAWAACSELLPLPCQDTGCGDMVCVPGGPVALGCETVEDGCQPESSPRHQREVVAFVVDRTETTVAAFADWLNTEPGGCSDADCGVAAEAAGLAWVEADGVWAPQDGRHDWPMTSVPWAAANAFCADKGGKLCTEVQWEAAAAGPCEGVGCLSAPPAWPWGVDMPDCGRATGPDCGGVRGVGVIPGGASRHGVLDMAGHVAEWVSDCWHPSYEGAPTGDAAWLDDCADPDERIVRGGSFQSADFNGLRNTARDHRHRLSALEDVGFRCCIGRPVP